MFNYSALETLQYVRKHSSISKAAQELGITQAAASIRLKSLEDSFGKPILYRSKTIKLTSFGEELLLHYLKVKLLEEDALKERTGCIQIPIAVNVESLELWFLKALQPFVQTHPNYNFQFLVDDQDVTTKYLAEAKAIAAISSSGDCPSGFESFFLGKMAYVFVANPFIIESFPLRAKNNKIPFFPLCRFSYADQLHEQFMKLYFPKEKISFTDHVIPSTAGLLEAALNGLGYAALPFKVAEKYINKGELVVLRPKHIYEIELYYIQSTLLSTGLKELGLTVREYAKKYF